MVLQGKRTLYLRAVGGSHYENISATVMDIPSFPGQGAGSIRDLFHIMAIIWENCSKEHTLVIIDGLPYLMDCDY